MHLAGRTDDALNVIALSDALASSVVEEKPLMKVSADVASLPVASPSNSEQMLFDSDGSDDPGFSRVQPMADSGRDEQVMLLDTGDEASSLQVPCLIPESTQLSGSLLPTNANDQTISASGVPEDAVDANIPNGSVQEPAQSQMFDFVNDVMKSSSPNSSNQSTALPYLRSQAAKKGGDQQLQNLTG